MPVRCTTRKFFLHHPPKERSDWHVRFTPPSIDGTRQVVFRSTGAKEIAAAKRVAARIIGSFWNDCGRGAEPPASIVAWTIARLAGAGPVKNPTCGGCAVFNAKFWENPLEIFADRFCF